MTGKPIEVDVASRVRAAAGSVFDQDPAVKPGARRMLRDLRRQGYRLALLTKGDRGVQEKRVASSGIRDLFDVIHIVPDKTPAAIRAVMDELGTEPESTWMVGNSIRSDVMPALAAGLKAIWIDAHVWEHERAGGEVVDERVYVADTLEDILRVLAA